MTTIKNQNPNTKPSKTGKIKKRSVEMTIALLGDTFNLPRELTKKIEKCSFWGEWRPSLLPEDFADECDTQLAFANIKDERSKKADRSRNHSVVVGRGSINPKSMKLQEKLYWNTITGINLYNVCGYDRIYPTNSEYVYGKNKTNGKTYKLPNLGYMRIQSGLTKPYKKLYVKSWDRNKRNL